MRKSFRNCTKRWPNADKLSPRKRSQPSIGSQHARILTGYNPRGLHARPFQKNCALAPGTGSSRRNSAHAPAGSLDRTSLARTDLFFRVLLSHFSNQRIDRSAGHTSSRPIPACCRPLLSGSPALVVCAHAFLAWLQRSCAHACVLAGIDRLSSGRFQFLAARRAGYLPGLLSLFCFCRAGVFQISIRRHVAGSRIYRALLCATGTATTIGRDARSFASLSVSSAVGVVPHLL